MTFFIAISARLRALLVKYEADLLVALRVGVSATLAYLIASLQHIPETYWPVLSAVIVARGGAKGTGGSAADRLIGTLAGAAVGILASFGHRLGIPNWLLLFGAMTPLAFLSSDNAAFRAAPMAAMIVLSASTAGGAKFGMGAAFLRVADVGLGTVVALFVSYVLLPSSALKSLKRDTAAALKSLADLLSLGLRAHEASVRARFARLNLRTRRELRELTIAARGIRKTRAEREAAESLPTLMAAAVGRAHGTIVFIQRAAMDVAETAQLHEALLPYARSVRARFGTITELLLHKTETQAGAALDAALEAAVARVELLRAGRTDMSLEALPFLLRTLRDDVDELTRIAGELSGPPRKRPAVVGAADGVPANS